MQYVFRCVSPKHPKEKERVFSEFVHLSPEAMKAGKRVDTWRCPECQGLSTRDYASEIPTQGTLGLRTVSTSTTVKGSLYQETSFAFGRRKTNPDGTIERSHAPFRDSGELEKFLGGKNDLGPPVLDDKGNSLRRPDGSVIRGGAKLFKYGPNDTPSKDAVRKGAPIVRTPAGDRNVDGDCWVDAPVGMDGRRAEGRVNPHLDAFQKTERHRGVGVRTSPIRRKRT